MHKGVYSALNFNYFAHQRYELSNTDSSTPSQTVEKRGKGTVFQILDFNILTVGSIIGDLLLDINVIPQA